MKSIREYISEKTAILNNVYNDERETKSVIELWLMNRLQKNKIDLYDNNNILSAQTITQLSIEFEKLMKNEPVQYILGTSTFDDCELSVGKDVLIPRPETEELVELVANYIDNHTNKNLKIIDACTGSGCIAISLKKRYPQTLITAFDYSYKILDYAINNAKKNYVNVDFFKYDLLSTFSTSINDEYDIVVSNPPYVLPSEKNNISARVKDYEPNSALFVPEEDPLLFYRKIVGKLNSCSTRFFFEINPICTSNWEQFAKTINKEIIFEKDFFGKKRFVIM